MSALQPTGWTGLIFSSYVQELFQQNDFKTSPHFWPFSKAIHIVQVGKTEGVN
jgi:hypothetical protein